MHQTCGCKVVHMHDLTNGQGTVRDKILEGYNIGEFGEWQSIHQNLT